LQNREPSELTLRGRLQVAAVCALIIAYTGLSFYCSTRGAQRLGAVLALAPPVALLLAVLWRVLHPAVAAVAAILATAVLYDCWPVLEKQFSIVCLFQECAMYGLLAIGFGRSLRAADTALCTRLADRLHGPLTARELRYTRQVTLAWTLFFAALTAAILALYVLAPLAVWSAFVNFAALPLVAAMFIGEYAVRRRVVPQTGRVGLLATLRTFLASR